MFSPLRSALVSASRLLARASLLASFRKERESQRAGGAHDDDTTALCGEAGDGPRDAARPLQKIARSGAPGVP